MHYFVAGVIATSIILCAAPVVAAESTMTIAVFTKNTTNPAYSAFRLAADQIGQLSGAKIRHFVPKQPDNVDEQTAMVEEVLKSRPDAVVFIPVDDVAMIEPVRKLNDAGIPIVLASNPLPAASSPMSAPTITTSAIARRATSSTSSAARAGS